MTTVDALTPGQPFSWSEGILVKTDATKTDVLGDKYTAVVIMKQFKNDLFEGDKKHNVCGATIWFRSDVKIIPIDMDCYIGDECIFRTYSENQEQA